MAAAQAGKHLIIEKPIALSWEDAKPIRDAVKKAGVRGCVCFEVRFSAQFTWPARCWTRACWASCTTREVDYYHGIGPWYGQFPWNVKKDFGGSSLLTAGCHALDILLWMMGAPVVEVTSYATRSQIADLRALRVPHDHRSRS